ncbi:MAG: two-component system response regulator CreB [Holophagaceae bacterium]|nr:two-component system response regulator CreB [Holophagaceae bacterium]
MMEPNILIVEDEPSIADTIAYALRTEGFHPSHAELGEAALTMILKGSFKLVILDVGLPDISGFEVCRRLRTFSDLPVIMLTARSEEVDRIVGLEIGADDYMVKPFSPRELVARVRVILRRLDRSNSQASATPFLVDEARHRIEFRGKALDLTRYEFRLLKTLLAHPEQVFTRSQLLEQVWPEAEESGDRTVDTHIKTLRAKLRAVEAEADPIQTHRGLGYSIGRV